ncbi:MAG: hypothetical protein AMXMBFR83_28720 [Phycisphaerae bacterium]
MQDAAFIASHGVLSGTRRAITLPERGGLSAVRDAAPGRRPSLTHGQAGRTLSGMIRRECSGCRVRFEESDAQDQEDSPPPGPPADGAVHINDLTRHPWPVPPFSGPV